MKMNNNIKDIVKDMVYDSSIKSYYEGFEKGSDMFYEYIEKVFDSKEDNFVLRREDIRMLMKIFKEGYKNNKI